eukprot:g85.t1
MAKDDKAAALADLATKHLASGFLDRSQGPPKDRSGTGPAPGDEGRFRFRRAAGTDVDAVASLWHSVYQWSHAALMPEGLLQYRTLGSFRDRVPRDLQSTIVAEVATDDEKQRTTADEPRVRGDGEKKRLLGFVTTRGPEVLHLFVAEGGRGIGAELLRRAEEQIRADVRADSGSGAILAHLHVVKGNEPARRFYDKQGWTEKKQVQYEVEILKPDGSVSHFPVPSTTLFRPVPIIAQPAGSETFECLAYGCNFLYVGTSGGGIVSFTIAASNRTDEELQHSGCLQRSVQLRASTGKKIEELVCPEGSNARIFAVCDGGIHILPGSLANSGTVLAKNALCFSLQTDPALLHATTEQFKGYDVAHGHICVASKRKLHLFRPVGSGGTGADGAALPANLDPDDVSNLKYELYQEIPLDRERTAPQLCRWHRNSILVGFKREYVLVNQDDGTLREIFQLQQTNVPRILILPNDEALLLHQDRVGLFFNCFTGQPSTRHTLEFQDKVLHVGSKTPQYIFGWSRTGTEIFSFRDQQRKQVLPFTVDEGFSDNNFGQNLTCVSDSNKRLFVAASGGAKNFVYCLSEIPLRTQLSKLLLEDKRQDALELLSAHLAGCDDVEPAKRHAELQNFHEKAGWVCFRRLRFADAFHHFSLSSVPFSHLIRFFADPLLPAEWRKELESDCWETARLLRRKALNDAPIVLISESPFYFCDEVVEGGEEEGNESAAQRAEAEQRRKERQDEGLDLRQFVAYHSAKLVQPTSSSGRAPPSERELVTDAHHWMARFLLKARGSPAWLQQSLSERKRADLLLLRLGDGAGVPQGARALLAQEDFSCVAADFDEGFLATHQDLYALLLKKEHRLEEALGIYARLLAEAGAATTSAAKADFVNEIVAILSKLLVAHHNQRMSADQSANSAGFLGGFGGGGQNFRGGATSSVAALRELVLSHLQTLPRAAIADLFVSTPLPSYQVVVAPVEVFRMILLGPKKEMAARAGAPAAQSLDPPSDLIESAVLSSANASSGGSSRRESTASAETRENIAQVQRYLEHLLLRESHLGGSNGAGEHLLSTAPNRELSTALAVLYAHSQMQSAASSFSLSAASSSSSSSTLAHFLDRASTVVDIDRILQTLNRAPANTFDWERCLLFRKQARHAEALQILCGGRLGGLQQAELYCLGAIGLAGQNFEPGMGSGSSSAGRGSEPALDLVLFGDEMKSGSRRQESSATSSSFWTREEADALNALDGRVDTAKKVAQHLQNGGQLGYGAANQQRAANNYLNNQPDAAMLGENQAAIVFQICFEVLLQQRVALRKVLAFAHRYYEFLQAERVLELLPDELPVGFLEKFLQKSILKRVHDQRQQQVEEKLSAAAYLKTYREWYQCRSVCVHLTSERCCPICHKRLFDRAFAADFRTLRVAHIHSALVYLTLTVVSVNADETVSLMKQRLRYHAATGGQWPFPGSAARARQDVAAHEAARLLGVVQGQHHVDAQLDDPNPARQLRGPGILNLHKEYLQSLQEVNGLEVGLTRTIIEKDLEKRIRHGYRQMADGQSTGRRRYRELGSEILPLGVSDDDNGFMETGEGLAVQAFLQAGLEQRLDPGGHFSGLGPRDREWLAADYTLSSSTDTSGDAVSGAGREDVDDLEELPGARERHDPQQEVVQAPRQAAAYLILEERPEAVQRRIRIWGAPSGDAGRQHLYAVKFTRGDLTDIRVARIRARYPLRQLLTTPYPLVRSRQNRRLIAVGRMARMARELLQLPILSRDEMSSIDLLLCANSMAGAA